MAHSEHPVWLQAVAAPGVAEGCGGCTPAAGLSACQALQGTRCELPALAVPAELDPNNNALEAYSDYLECLRDKHRMKFFTS